MNLDATGPDEIRAAFGQAAEAAGERSQEVGGIASVLVEAADRYETLQMHPSTLGHLRDAATAFTTAQGSLSAAQEQLTATLADFNAHDGQVADATEAGGTRASREISAASGEAFVANPANVFKEITVNDMIPNVDPAAPAHAGSADALRIRDLLRVADTMVLRDGENFAGSASVRDGEGLMVLAAAVDTADGRVVHVAVPVPEESKADWKGAHTTAQESRIDPEDGDTYSVNTYSDATAIIGADDVAELPARVDDVIAQAAKVDREYRQLIRKSDRLHKERLQLELARFADAADAALQLRLDSSERQHYRCQQRRWAYVQDCLDRLGPDDRAGYEDLQRRIAAAGVDRFEPGREDLAAEVCGLTVREYRELVDIRRKPRHARTRDEQTRHDVLSGDRKPLLLAEQAAIIHGLSVDEYREWEALTNLGEPRTAGPYRSARGRTPEQQARYNMLQSSPRGATGATPGQTMQIRSQFDAYQRAHHSDKLTWTAERLERAELAARARPLDQVDAARLKQVIAEYDKINDRCEALGGEITARVEIPGHHNAKLVVEAVQREEDGGVDYQVRCVPPNAAEDGSLGDDPYRTTASGLRKLAKTLANLGIGR
ncbi:hypothetical protein [Micromonospora noduli]|uniref:Uncharacterized protein n=1 Tax=Micromonospora noduli TaxID=709876 RepID=A0A328N5G8_9ACTN|nr:hypothetical protein [Micromonospora noduli]RAO03101.1 hypothetical protein LAH08_02111 [Micromonospora noduli]